jgi:hypothetical protein
LPVGATAGIVNYAFDMEMEHYDFSAAMLHGRRRNVRYRLCDGPGGSLLPQGIQMDSRDTLLQARFRSQLVATAQNSQALVLCVDGDDESQSQSFFGGLSELLADMRREGERYLRFESIVIVLTKVDSYVEHSGKGAFAAAVDSAPWDRALELLTDSGIAALLNLTDPAVTELLCGWASVYGFCEDGSSNYDSREKRLRTWSTKTSEQDVLRSWRPFQLLDAFVYLSVGELGGLQVFRRQ